MPYSGLRQPSTNRERNQAKKQNPYNVLLVIKKEDNLVSSSKELNDVL